MSGVTIQVLQLVLCLSILVTLHEMGHFLAAKYFGTKVEKFMLFFDPYFAIFKKKIGETVYGIGWLPLGGYVKIAGMIDESMDTEQMKKEPQPWEFRSKPAWQRLIIMLGGIIVNVLLAWFIYTMLLTVNGDNYISVDKMQESGMAYSPAMKQAGFQDGDKIISVDGKKQPRADWMAIDLLLSNSVEVDRNGERETIKIDDNNIKSILNGAMTQGPLFSPQIKNVIIDSLVDGNAKNAGLQNNDRILAINGEEVKNFNGFRETLHTYKGDSVVLEIVRGGEASSEVRLEKKVLVSDSGAIGFYPKGLSESELGKMTVHKEYNFFQALPVGFNKTFENLAYQIKQFKLIIRPKTEAYKQVSGPLRLYKVFDASWDWTRFWNFTAMFSIWLAFLNLLPIPALDGGHAMFTIIEMVTGKKMSQRTMELAQITGFFILMGLMILVFGNDIYHLIMGN